MTHSIHIRCFSVAVAMLLMWIGGCDRQDELSHQGPETPELDQSDPPIVFEKRFNEALIESEREFLWDAEHRGNVLGRYGFKPLIEAWQQRDRDRMLQVLSDNAAIEMLDLNASDSLSITTEAIDGFRHESLGDAKTLSREAFVDWLLEHREKFANDPLPKGGFYVMQLSPPKDQDEDTLWTVTCINRFWGEGADGGRLEINNKMILQAHELTKDRLSEPAWLESCNIVQYDSIHTDRTLFEEITDSSGLKLKSLHDNWEDDPKLIQTGGLYACDYNRDGLTDLIITEHNLNAGGFYEGLGGGKFKDVTVKLRVDRVLKASKAAIADLDNDGWVDLILPSEGIIYRNVEGKKFAPVTQGNIHDLLVSAPIASPQRIGGVIPGDFDRDGDIDLYVTRSIAPVGSWLESLQPHLKHNQLLRNRGNWIFDDVTDVTGVHGGGRSSFSAVWVDVNNDLWPDLYVINEFGPGVLYLNEQGKSFSEHGLMEGQNDFGSMGVTCGDVDNDGLMDIYVASMYSKAGSRIMNNLHDGLFPEDVTQRLKTMVAGGELYANQGDLKFDPIGKKFQIHAAGWAWGSSLADFNNDGWLDLHVTAGFMSRDRTKPDG